MKKLVVVMSTIKLMIPNPTIISGFDMYKENPKPLFQSPYKMPDNYYDHKGSFNTYFKSHINGFNYIPKINIAHNLYSGLGPQLYIETSISKALFGNNYEEWMDKDLEMFVKWLISVLKAMGIETKEETILHTTILKFHFAKNFIFPDEQTFKLFFEILKKIKYPWLKGKSEIYPNGGISYCYYSDIFSISFYDKLSELSIKHPKLVGELRANGINYVLRAEIQVNDRQKLKRLMKEFGFDGEITLATMFQIKRLISVFDKVFNKLHQKAPYFYNYTNNINDLLESIAARVNSMSELSNIFLKLMLDKKNGIVGAKKLIAEFNIRGKKAFIKKNNQILTSNPYIQNIFSKLLDMVKEYEPIQHSKFDEQKFIYFKI